jgi:hypothetical protein
MKKGGIGGGSTITGLNFEKETDILDLLKKKKGYKVISNIVYYQNQEVARSYVANYFVSFFLF